MRRKQPSQAYRCWVIYCDAAPTEGDGFTQTTEPTARHQIAGRVLGLRGLWTAKAVWSHDQKKRGISPRVDRQEQLWQKIRTNKSRETGE